LPDAGISSFRRRSGCERDAYHFAITPNGLTPERDGPMRARGGDPWQVTSRGEDGVRRNRMVISLDVLVVTGLVVLAVAVHW
jgi:hypothetical protein